MCYVLRTQFCRSFSSHFKQKLCPVSLYQACQQWQQICRYNFLRDLQAQMESLDTLCLVLHGLKTFLSLTENIENSINIRNSK